jgi:acyl-CoA thioesterase II
MRIQHLPFGELMNLEPHGPDTYVGLAAEYPWGRRLFGGQVVAQGLRAAFHTVSADRPVHSLHAYFIRPGMHDEPVRYEVERLRDGGSFSTRQVVARQSGGAILNVSVSFQADEGGADVQLAQLPTDIPHPEDPLLLNHGWGRLLDRRRAASEPGTANHWIRLTTDDLGDDPIMHACGLAFLSDSAPTSAARSCHPDSTGDLTDRDRFIGASLDHAMWFHRPTRADEWHWFAMRSHGLRNGRGLVSGECINANGEHIATISQELLLRQKRSPSL